MRTRPLALAAFAAAAGLVAVGCVTRGTHDAVVQDRDQYRARAELLERSNASLAAERVKLYGELEDLRQAREVLDKSVKQLERKRAELAEGLTQREAELAARRSEIRRLRSTYDGLVQDLESQVASGEIQIEQLREGLRLNLSQQILFPPGQVRLNPAGRDVLRTVAARLGGLDHRIEVQGHTDDVPIASERFPSNWELAAARASEVVRLLQGEGVGGDRLTAISFGEHHPVASNDTPEGRARNRRIEIRLLPERRPVDTSLQAPLAAPAE